MGNKKSNNLFLVLILMLILIGIPYLLYTIGSFVEINYFGYINNWWVVLLFIFVLISIFILGEINFEKNMVYFFLLFFTIPFFILGMRLGVKSTLDSESYALLLDKEQEINHLDSILLKLENDFAQLEIESQKEQAHKSLAFKNHEIIFFNSGSAKLSDFNKERIKAFISSLENCKLNVKGYTDAIGNRPSNKDISDERARNVADFIKSIDQHNNRINEVVSFGAEHQLVENSNEISRSKNRRVTIEIVGKIDEETKAMEKKIQDEINKIREDRKNSKMERDSLMKLIFQGVEE